MQLQNSQANCGPAAAHNALKALGLNRSVEELEKLFSTSATEGTEAKKMVAGLSKIDELLPRRIEESKEEIAHLRLDAALRSGRPAVLCVDNFEHYVCAIGRLGDSRVLVADSADGDLVLSYDWSELMGRWGCVGAKKPYWAVVL